MLVFLTTYAFPLAAVMVAATARVFVGDGQFAASARWRWICVGLEVAGMLVSFAYHSSPFRTLDRDFEASCRDAASKLKANAGLQIVSVGSGPYPDRGVGWEAGFVTAHLANRLILATGGLPTPVQVPLLMEDIRRSAPSAVLVWGRPGDTNYQLARQSLEKEYRNALPIQDPALGEVGWVLLGQGLAN